MVQTNKFDNNHISTYMHKIKISYNKYNNNICTIFKRSWPEADATTEIIGSQLGYSTICNCMYNFIWSVVKTIKQKVDYTQYNSEIYVYSQGVTKYNSLVMATN